MWESETKTNFSIQFRTAGDHVSVWGGCNEYFEGNIHIKYTGYRVVKVIKFQVMP